MFIPNNSTVPKLQTAEDLQGDALLHYDAEMELMNLILLSIPNDIYNSVDACTSAKDMWKRVERLMRGTIQNKVDRETRFYKTNMVISLLLKPGEALVSQFEKLVNVSRAKKLEKSHDPLALVAHTGSSSRNTSSYYVTHPTSVVDYEDEYQQDDVHTNSEDPLASAMLLLARAITQNFSTPTNNRLRTSSNTRNQAIIQGDRVNIQSRNSSNAGRNNRRAYVQEEIVEGSNAPNETKNVQRTLRTSSSGNTSTDESGVILTNEQNDFLFADASRMEEIEELSANICLMARIQPADNTSDAGPSYDYVFISEVQSSSNNENEKQMYPTHTKIINSTIGDDQIDSDIIFDSPNRNVNSDSIEKDTHVPDLCNSEISLNIRDTEDTLDDASKSQQKVYEKMNDPIAVANKQNYQKLFNSTKKTRSQTQTEIDELIDHVSKKTYAYGAIRAENPNLLFTISELKTRLANVEKGKSVNTKFDKINGSQPLLCVTPLHKYVIQKKTDVQKSEENHVVSKPITLHTSPTKQRGVNLNKNFIAPGMYKVITTHVSQTNEAKHDLYSTGMNAASCVRRPMNKDSHVKDSVLANSKKSAKKVTVYVRKNKQTNNTSENVITNKENVIDVDVANTSKAKTLLCVSCMQNVLIPCHANCFANYKLNVHSNVRRNLSTKSKTPKSYDTTYVVHKTRFSKESTLSKSLDTTYVVSKPKIDVESTSKANDKVVQIVLWIVDSGCSKHMTGDRSLLKNFIEKFMGTVSFGNDNFAAITGYGDYIQGDITICHVYYVEGDDLLTGGRESNLYTISISDMATSLPVCLMSKATSTKSWLWHRKLSHLNFGTINDLTRLDLVDGLPKFKYGKDHLCSTCERGKSKKASHPLKLVPSDHSKLELLHMDLCGPMRVASINGKKYILVIVDDYSRYTWVYFLHSKDETLEIIKKFIA
ncbi:integrase, catalytic region, zinc finger, CCHC-type containing protein [Tanacetum coccineum]|uniref:Integrase, catalytic region, zinc finger, CCHC-type containing protein n=1 Tax=Tanacetum coccineum TaxID=301880 RepID=A0ABQ5I9R2_9ASTR